MLDQQKISMGMVRQAYGLNENDVEKTLQVLWPDSVYPVELWRRAHEKYWRDFADSNQAVYSIESPALPEIDLSAKYFHPHLCALDVMTFFRKLSLNIQASVLRKGLNSIVEESYEDVDKGFPDEREFLFSTLSRLEPVDIYEQYSPDSELFEEKILSVPVSSYHFITHIFSDTIAVDRKAAVHYWSVIRSYPLKKEVRGITHRFVNSVVKEAAQGTLSVPKAAPTQEELNAEVQPQEEENIIRVPAALWEGRPPAAVRDTMRNEYSDAVIASVLFRWCKVQKTTIGKLLLAGMLPPDKMPTDGKTFRNLTNKLLKEAESLTIINA